MSCEPMLLLLGPPGRATWVTALSEWLANLRHKVFHDKNGLLSLALEMCIEDEDLLL